MWKGELQSNGLKMEYRITKKIALKKSKFQKIEILQTLEHGKLLLLDGLVMLNEKEEFTYHEMLAHVPLFYHKNPRKILIIGGGDGGTARECLKHPVDKVTLCEIDKDVLELSRQHLETGKSLQHKRLKVVVGDGMQFLRESKDLYDVILVDGTDPIGPGKILFSQAFCNLVKNHLSPGGIYCTQSESPFGKYKKIISQFRKTLEKTYSYNATYGVSIPMYPSGYWCFAIASTSTPKFNSGKYSKHFQSLNCKYYNSDVHEGAFLLPEFVKKLISK